MTTKIDTAAVRDALVPATARDLRRRTVRRTRGVRVAVLATAGVVASTGVAAATGVLFAPPQPDPAVPAVAPWTYAAQNPYAHGGGPVLLRHRPEALARDNRAAEAGLAERGVTARCGTDPGHPLACFLPGGDPVPAAELGPVLVGLDDAAADYDVRALSAAEAHAWLCAHPTQRPGADGGERPAPTAGYGDC
jgi:hypothetical protein